LAPHAREQARLGNVTLPASWVPSAAMLTEPGSGSDSGRGVGSTGRAMTAPLHSPFSPVWRPASMR
jgi:hypothetical protein